MVDADCAVLAVMLPDLLLGNWTEGQLVQLLDSPHHAHRCRVLCENGAAGEVVVGFLEFTVVLDDCELLALAVKAGAQGRGLGRTLLACFLDELRGFDCRSCHLEVRRSNKRAIALYEGQGFQPGGQRKGYYPPLPGQQAAEDALLYVKTL